MMSLANQVSLLMTRENIVSVMLHLNSTGATQQYYVSLTDFSISLCNAVVEL